MCPFRRPVSFVDVMVAALVASALASCSGSDAPSSRGAATAGETPACDTAAAARAARLLGSHLQDVSLLAPDSIRIPALREAYGGLVTDSLLAAWVARPGDAPGRGVSSPWPDHIEVRRVEGAGGGACRVEAEVVYATSADAPRSVRREPVTIRVVEGDGWRVASWEGAGGAGDSVSSPATLPSDSATAGSPSARRPSGAAASGTALPSDSATSAAAAADVIRRYYAAIEAGDYPRAYRLWGNGGESSGQTLEGFTRGFDETAHVEADVGAPGRVEGAAGSRYVDVPVEVRATTTAGEHQRFRGTYTLRRTVIEGSTPAMRRWHITSADIRQVP